MSNVEIVEAAKFLDTRLRRPERAVSMKERSEIAGILLKMHALLNSRIRLDSNGLPTLTGIRWDPNSPLKGIVEDIPPFCYGRLVATNGEAHIKNRAQKIDSAKSHQKKLAAAAYASALIVHPAHQGTIHQTVDSLAQDSASVSQAFEAYLYANRITRSKNR